MEQNSTFEFSIQIAGLPTRLSFVGLAEERANRLGEYYSAFIQDKHPEEFSIKIFLEQGDPFITPEGRSSWLVETTNRNGRIEFYSFFERGWVDIGSRRGELVMRPDGDPENFLRVLYAWRLLDVDALLVHASGLIRDGRGFVFFGPSGSGKTTITRLSHNEVILSDDLVILKNEIIDGKETVVLYGVPFRGEIAEAPRNNASAPLAGLFKLTKNLEHKISALSDGVGVASLSSCVPFVMAEAKHARRVLDLCQTIAERITILNLEFSKDSGFWNLIDDSISYNMQTHA